MRSLYLVFQETSHEVFSKIPYICKMKPLLSALLVFGFLTIHFGCNKNPTESYFLSDEMKSQNPFSGDEKLYFITDSAVQYVFTGGERRNVIHEISNGSDGGYYLYEIDKMDFSAGNNYGFNYDMQHVSRRYPIFQIHFSCNGKGMVANFDMPISKENTQTVDSIYIMGQWQYDIFISEKEKVDNWAYKLYYSTEFGIVKIDFSDGTFWELEKIEW